MPIEVKMAKLSPTMESGQLVKWLVKVGDPVKEGDTLAEIQTDKAVMPMEAFDEGTVAKLDVKEGDDIALGQRVLLLAKKGEDPKQVAAAASGGGAPAKAAAPTTAEGDSGTNRPQDPATNGQGRPAPVAQPAATTAEAAPAPAAGGRVKSTPLARKVAAASGLDLSQVPGSGPAGRVIRADVEAFLSRKPADAPTPAASPFSVPAGQPVRIPHTPMRKTIAARMLQSKQAAPEIHVTVDVRMDAIMAVRERLNKQLEREKVKLSVGDFVTKAVAIALRKHPAVNASYEADAIVQHGDVNVGIAVALDGGLIVPVLHRADKLGLVDIRRGTQALTDAARSNKLVPKQMMGGTFTISNLGMYGVKQFDAILNLPEVGILAVGGTDQRPVVDAGQLAVGWVMTVTLTADHRAVDGATAAEFLRTFKGLLEEPAAMLL